MQAIMQKLEKFLVSNEARSKRRTNIRNSSTVARCPYDNGMLNAEASNLPTVKSLIRTHGNPNKVPSGMVSHIIQLHIAASAKHLQAIMMLCLNWGASFPTESSSGNAEGKQQQKYLVPTRGIQVVG